MISGDGRGAGRITKSGFKSILASVLIIAMLLSTMGGATYSWFSDSYTSSVEVGTGTVDHSISVTYDYKTSSTNEYRVVSQIDVTYTNVGTLPIIVESSFRVDLYGVYSGRSMDYYYWDHNDENGNEFFEKLNVDANLVNPVPIIVTVGNINYTINFERVDGDINRMIEVEDENSLSQKNAVKRIQWKPTITFDSAQEPTTTFDPIYLEVGADAVTHSYQISFPVTKEDSPPMDGIPLQFYTVGFQPDYNYKQSTADTTGISHEEKPMEASIRQIEESAEVYPDPHFRSSSDSEWIPEADVFDSAIIGKEEESDPRSAQYAQSSINRHSGSDADAPEAVAP